MKLGAMDWRKVMEADFRKKNVGAQIWAKRGQNGPKMSFFCLFLELKSLNSAVVALKGSGP